MAAMLPTDQVIGVLLELFGEAYEGPQRPYSWFTDQGPEAGIFGSVAGFSAEEASDPTASGSTVAGHVEHLRWSLALANQFLRGENPQPKWRESWSVREVSPAAWERLQADLRQEYETLQQAIRASSDWSQPMALTGAMALVPHAAYHLGAIRQMLATKQGAAG